MPAKSLPIQIILALMLLLSTPYRSEAASAYEIDVDVTAALKRFYNEVGGAPVLVEASAGVLVFPSVVKVGMGVGGEYGEGALRRHGRTEGYYNTVAASFGFQLGVQARTVIIVFMTEEALWSFQRKDGWKVGVDGSVALV